MKYFSFIVIVLSWMLKTQALAAISYNVIVEAGDRNSHLHLYQYTNDTVFPQIIEIYTNKNNYPIASFSGNAISPGKSLAPLLDDLVKQLQKMKIKEMIQIEVLGTASMRLLSFEQQNAIYSDIKKYIVNHYQTTFMPTEIKTISGKMQGIYEWLTVNYLENNLQQHTPTSGIISVGRVSTQIAFAVETTSKPIDEIMLKINGKNYRIFSKSFLGLGLDQVRESIKNDEDARYCFPKNFPFNSHQLGQFNLVNCSAIYQQLLDTYQIEKQIPPVYKVKSFVAISGAYYVYHFFGNDISSFDQETLEQTIIIPSCRNTWNTLKEAYGYETEEMLGNYCADGVYLTNLIYTAYQIQNKQLKILKTINGRRIDWALGAVLYHYLQNSFK